MARHPGLQVRLEVFDRLVDVAAEGFDLDVRVGDEIAAAPDCPPAWPTTTACCVPRPRTWQRRGAPARWPNWRRTTAW